MSISVFDLFSVGIGPSSSHTVGPMRAAKYFINTLIDEELLRQTTRVSVELFGSLGATGKGHGSGKAVLLGLEGESAETVSIDSIPKTIARINETGQLKLAGIKLINFDQASDLIMHRHKSLPYHSNGLSFEAFDASGESILHCCYYSVGGGFVIDEQAASADAHIVEDTTPMFYTFSTAKELLSLCHEHQISISDLMFANECMRKTEKQVYDDLLDIWNVMQDCVASGCKNDGILPGGLKVKRRAPSLYQKLSLQCSDSLVDPLTATDWVTLYALAVNEENAAGGRVVTAPTNGAAGVIPAVLHYCLQYYHADSSESEIENKVVRFLLTAAAVGILFKENASISGAEVGCQGEIGSACSMAAAGLTEVLGGTPEQVENAAEIAMEHNLGLTCDPIGGLVQVPCIERNAMAAVKAITASRMALRGDGQHFVSLDKVIKTMRETGRDMRDKYKETARGGLAINVMELPVNLTEC